MINLYLNDLQYEYDIHALVKSFYPREEFVITNGVFDAFSDQRNVMEIVVESDRARMSFYGNDGVRKDYEMVYEASDLVETHRKKNAFKRFLYRTLSDYTGRTLPWGNLTGIRPTKIAMTLLEDGAADEEILFFLKENHYVSEEKARLSIEIAHREQEILADVDYANGYSLYVGIPFCPTTCLYCSFTSYPVCVWEKKMPDYLAALKKELLATAEMMRGHKLDTVYIGGGTPTSLSPELLEELLSFLDAHFEMEKVLEFTVEAGRADSITEAKLAVLKAHHVTRISVNPQTMHDETLRLIGRQHSVSQVVDAYRLARRLGFDNINMDIILGLPQEDDEDVAATIQEIEKLRPDSLTVHSLAIKRASRLNRFITENGYIAMNNTDATMEIASNGAARMEMHPYYLYRQKNMAGNLENVGFAAEGKAGIYNILIMEEKQTIAACGAGTVTKRVYPGGRIEREDDVKDVALYIERIDEMIAKKRSLLED